jgi:2-iminobutanoate/2-iminopropanoate deaminase
MMFKLHYQGRPMERQIIQPTSVHSTKGVGYSHVARVGPMVFLAGQVALDKEGRLVGKGDIEAQCTQAYANIKSILEELGGGMNDMVKLTTYLVRRQDLQGFRNVRNRTLGPEFVPNTLVFIDGLASEDYLVEIEVIAVIQERGKGE